MRPYMTEEEANRKWCPIAKRNPLGPSEKYYEARTHYQCNASKCMFWGWKQNKKGCVHGRCEPPVGVV